MSSYDYNSFMQSSTGVSSGIDWGSMVDAVVEAKREQYAPLEDEKEILELKIGLLEEMSANFKTVQSALTTLTLASTYEKKTAEFTVYSPSGMDASNIITATPTTDAALQNWDIEIEQLATTESRISTRVSDRSESLGLEGTFYINVGGARAKIEVETGDSLLDINYKITNATDEITGESIAVEAQLIDNRLVISSSESGLGEVATNYISAFRGEFDSGTGGTDYLVRTPEETLTKGSSDIVTIGNPTTRAVPPSVTLYDTDGNAIDKDDYSYDSSTGELTWDSGAIAEGTEYVVQWDYPPFVAEIECGDTTYTVGTDFTYDNATGTINWTTTGNHPDEGEEYTVYFSNTLNLTGTGSGSTTDISAYAPSGGFASGNPMEITVGGTTYTEGTEFTFDRDTGIIDWTGGSWPLTTEPVGSMSIDIGTGSALSYYSNVFTLESGTGDDILGSLNLDATEEGEYWSKAQDAKLTLNGVGVTRSSNTIDDLIAETTLELKNTGHVAMEIVLDTEEAIEAINEFITAYNDAMDWINVRLSEEEEVEQDSEDWQTSEDFDKKFGLLHGSSLLWQTKSRLRRLISDPLETLGSLSMLSQLGITTDDEDYGKSGELVFDEEKFLAALTPGEVSYYDQWMTDSLSSSTEPLSEIRDGFTAGSFSVTVGGKTTTIKVTNTDTLNTLAQKINNATLDSTGSSGGTYSYNGSAPVRAKVVDNILAIISEDVDEDLYIQDTDGVLKSLGLDVTETDDAEHHVLGTEYCVAELMSEAMSNLDDYMDSLVSSSTVTYGDTSTPEGRIASEIYFMEKEIDYIDERIADYEDRISLTEARLWKQYAAAEEAIALYSAQLSSLTSTFNNLNGTSSSE